MNKPLPITVKPALILGIFTLVCTTALSLIYQHTKKQIADNQQAVILNALNEIIPPTLYDNDLLNDTALLYSQPELGSQQGIVAYRARKHGQPIAVIMTPIAPDGYNGDIQLLIGILYDGRLAGVRIVEHRETPGLGDAIELSKSDWLLSFNDKSLRNPLPSAWAVKKDGGEFDAFTGATITPRAVVKAVFNALNYYQKEKSTIFQ